jgi:hypothetical protein
MAIAERDAETLGGQILKVCTRFDALVQDGMSFVQAVEALLAEPQEYDPLFVAAFRELPIAVLPYEPRKVTIKDLTVRMVLNEEVRTTNGTLLVRRGVEVTDVLLARLRSFHDHKAIGNTFQVLVPVGAGRLHNHRLSDLSV